MLRAVGSAGLPEDVSVAAPVRTCTDGHSKSGGRVGPPAADALALLAVPASFANDPQESLSWDCVHPPSTGPDRASAAIRPRHGKRNSDTPTHAPHTEITPQA